MTRTKLDDVWHARDYPMLVAIKKQVEAAGLPLPSYELETNLEEEDQHRALRALEARGLITTSDLAGLPDGVKSVDGRAYLLAGLHPDGDDVREGLVSVLEQRADIANDEEEASALRKTANEVGRFSRDKTVVIAGALGTREADVPDDLTVITEQSANVPWLLEILHAVSVTGILRDATLTLQHSSVQERVTRVSVLDGWDITSQHNKLRVQIALAIGRVREVIFAKSPSDR